MKTLIALLWFGLAGAALAQTQTDENQAIIVTGQHRDAQTVRSFVETISIALPAADAIARWNDRICPGVAGASAADAQVIIDQIARRANVVGLRTEQSGCTPNISIVVTTDSDRFAHQMYERRPELLNGASGIRANNLGAAALQAFLNSPRPIRWWHVSRTVMSDGHELSDTRSSPNGHDGREAAVANIAAGGESGSASPPTLLSTVRNGAGPTGGAISGVEGARSNGSRLSRTTRQDFNYVVVIVDANRLHGAPISAVADYIALVCLAQINPDMNTANYSTILNLFADSAVQPKPSEMTAWDVAFLGGLYHMTRNARTLAQQRGEISHYIVEAQ